MLIKVAVDGLVKWTLLEFTLNSSGDGDGAFTGSIISNKESSSNAVFTKGCVVDGRGGGGGRRGKL
jgi:hypothetical protein